MFNEFIISYLAQINMFKEACKPFIYLDGTFLKSEVEGVLLSAMGRDANNHMFPLAAEVLQKRIRIIVFGSLRV